jgi:cytochrome P450
MHTNENLFPEPEKFKPERWLNNPKGPNGATPLYSYMTAFGKGTRMCAGLNMVSPYVIWLGEYTSNEGLG